MTNIVNQPLAGKTVKLRRISPKKPAVTMGVVTGSDGCYRFTNLKNGTYKINVSRCNGGGVKTIVIAGGGRANGEDFQCE